MNNSETRRSQFDKLDINEEFAFVPSIVGESYIIIPSDVGISRHVYADGHFGWGNVEKAFRLLGADYNIDTFIDIGANIGTICIPVVKRGFAKRAVAFEPEPRNYRALAANIYLNDLAGKIEHFNLALGSDSGRELIFELSPDNGGDHRVRVSDSDGKYSESQRKQIVVKSETLDKIALQLDYKSTLIWMDTQGYEGYILKGAEKFLANKVPMVTEFWPYGLDRADCYHYFKEACLRYDSFYDLAEEDPKLKFMSEDTLQELYDKFKGGDDNTDLLLI